MYGTPYPATTGTERRRVLVTGAAGFIGSHLVDALLATGHEVVGVDRRSPVDELTAEVNLAEALATPGFSFVPLDLTTAELAPVVRGCEVVFHLAGIPGVRSSWGAQFGEYVTSNILATARLLEVCERSGVRRIVVASSSSVYGTVRRASRESDPTRPISPYGVTKLAAEQLCLAHAHRRDTTLSAAGLRYFTVYGPRQRADMAIGRVLTAALDGLPLELYGDGSQRREFTYVSDVVAATIAAGWAHRPPPVVNVGGGASVTMSEVVELAGELAGSPVPVVRAAAQAGDVSMTEADLTVARAALGYQPTVGLRDGMARHLDWLRSVGSQRRRALYAGLVVSCAS